jgi:transposase
MTKEDLKETAQVYGFTDEADYDWKEITGLFDEANVVTIIERSYKKIHLKKKKYRLIPKNKTDDDKQIIVTAPGPEKLIPGCGYSIDFAATVVGDKYLYHLPLERQCRQMDANGLKGMVPKTLYNLAAAVSVHMEPVAERIKAAILESKLAVNCDETPWPINNAKDDDGYMWTISNQAGSYYRFEPTRSGKVINEILKEYKGPVLSDGYTGYNILKEIDGITLANCWAHARRKFIEIQENYPSLCEEILKLMDGLFALERTAQSYDELKALRDTQSRPLIDKIKEWLVKTKTHEARPESGLMSAVDYCLKYWPGLTEFLNDVRIPLTNNDAERALRHAVMGRKNFHGSRSINGADVAATLYTVIESCKKVELDPVFYLKMAVHQSARGQSPPTPLEYAQSSRAN